MVDCSAGEIGSSWTVCIGTKVESDREGLLSGKAGDSFSSLSGLAAMGTDSSVCSSGPTPLIGSKVSSSVLDAGVRLPEKSGASGVGGVSGAADVKGKSSASGVDGAGSC